MLSFADWNDHYTLLLRKQNKLERDMRAAWRDPNKSDKLRIKWEAAKIETENWRVKDRASGHVMRNRTRFI